MPTHIGFIPDGNRRWAEQQSMPKRAGYPAGITPGLALLDQCRTLGIQEVSIYGFTKENTHRPKDQVEAFRDACVAFAAAAVAQGASLCVIGDADAAVFPPPLQPYAGQRCAGDIRVNLLVNYGWQWDLAHASRSGRIGSELASRIDLIVRWGGRRRLSGFLPAQSAYADIYVHERLWPDMQSDDLIQALAWYSEQDITLGG